MATAVLLSIFTHIYDRGDDYFSPVADVYLELDHNSRAEHTFSLQRGHAVRGGAVTARVVALRDLGDSGGVHRAEVDLLIGFNLDETYDGWGWSRLERPNIYGWAAAARPEGEGSHRHTRLSGEMTFLRNRLLPTSETLHSRHAPTYSGSCYTDYGHDLCEWMVTVPVTGEDRYIRVQLRERFR